MCRTVQHVINTYTTTWNRTPVIVTLVNSFNQIINELSVNSENAEILSTGVTEQKMLAELDAVNLGVHLAEKRSCICDRS